MYLHVGLGLVVGLAFDDYIFILYNTYIGLLH